MMRVMKGIRVGRPKGLKREVPLHKADHNDEFLDRPRIFPQDRDEVVLRGRNLRATHPNGARNARGVRVRARGVKES